MHIYQSNQSIQIYPRAVDGPFTKYTGEDMKNRESTEISGLSKIERRKIANQYRILEKLSEGREAEQFGALAGIFEQGYVYLYGQAIDHIWDEMPENACKEVIDILELHRVLLLSLKDLPGSDQQSLLEEIKFKGFDGNEEADYYCFATFFCEELDRYNELKIVNSHSPTLSNYRAQLEKWEAMDRSIHLTKAQIELIAKDSPVAL